MIIKQNNKITKEKLAEELNLSKEGVKYHLKKLRKKGLKWIGSSKSGHWKFEEKQVKKII